jgi:hypothetical protein
LPQEVLDELMTGALTAKVPGDSVTHWEREDARISSGFRERDRIVITDRPS